MIELLVLELKTIKKQLALSGLIALTLLSGCKRDISGAYLTNDKSAICWLQLVRTPDESVTGQLVSSTLQQDGKVDHNSVSLNGVVNGENVTLTGGGFLGIESTTLSGSFSGETLTLTGVQSKPVVLKRATLADYQVSLVEQTARSQTIKSALATTAERERTSELQDEFTLKIHQLVAQIGHFDAEADVHLGRFSNVEKSYEAITAKITEYVIRERQFSGMANHAVDRSRLSVAANQASLNTNQMHFQGQALQSSIETNIAPLISEVTALEQACHRSGSAASNLTPAEIKANQSVCSLLLGAAPTFHQKYIALTAGLNHLEDVYQNESNAQARLLAESEKLE